MRSLLMLVAMSLLFWGASMIGGPTLLSSFPTKIAVAGEEGAAEEGEAAPAEEGTEEEGEEAGDEAEEGEQQEEGAEEGETAQ
jgi:hypothetical protein